MHWSNASRLWQGQSVMIEPHQGFVAAAGGGFRVPTGLGVTLMPLRHPYEAALQARSPAMATGQPVIAGFGPGGRLLQRWLGVLRPGMAGLAGEVADVAVTGGQQI